MKIRTDFVSNSSSSSFCIFGEAFESREIAQAFKDLAVKDPTVKAKYVEFVNDANPDGDDCDVIDLLCDYIYEILEFMEDYSKDKYGARLKFHNGISDFYDQYVIGFEFDQMKSDETKQMFLDRCSTVLNDVMCRTDINASQLIDGGYDN